MVRIIRTTPFTASVLLFGLLAPAQASATTYTVGPGSQYTSILTLPALTAGDVVEIQPGTYNEARRWTDSGTATSPLIIRGVGTPTPLFDGTGVSVTGAGSVPRALFQIEGDHYVIENLEFTNARNGNNGAGIRVLGDDVTVRGCKITYCDMGMMGGQDGLLVEESEVAFNGTSLFDGYSHNFYLGGAKTTIQFCYIHDAPYGQNFKTRAHYTELLYNFIADSNEGEVGPVDAAGTDTSSPESNMLMVGNIVVSKAGRTGNTSKFIDFGSDNSGTGLHNGTLFLFNNTLVAGDSRIIFMTASAPDSRIVANNNVFYGSDRILGSAGAGVTGANNWVPTSAGVPAGFTATVTLADPGFVDGPGRDYHLSATSQCLEAGTGSLDYRDGNGASGSGAPGFHYVHPLMSETRTTVGVIDIGAYERGGGGVAPDGGVAVDGSAGSGTGGAAAVDGSAAGASATGGAGATPSTGGTGAALQDSGSAGNAATSEGAAAQLEDDSGCGCRFVDARQDDSWAWLALAAALVGLRRPRRIGSWHNSLTGTAKTARTPPVARARLVQSRHHMRRMATRSLALSALALGLLACGSNAEKEPGDGPISDRPLEPGQAVDLRLSSAQATELAAVEGELSPQMTASDFAARYSTKYVTALGYDPLGAAGLDLIQASPLAPNADETAKLAENGFVISARQQFPSFVYGYQSIYMADLPVYVSADSILDAVHRSYDDILKAVELATLVDDARAMLTAMRAGVPEIADATTRSDADLYLTVAASLLDGTALAPVAGASSADAQRFFEAAQSASGASEVTLFGVARLMDFSQFKPRGHYTDDPVLEKYFRALMWLGRVDFRLIETEGDGKQVFRRRQVDAMLALHSLMQSGALAHWSRMDAVIRAFVGESDYMTVPEVDRLLADLGGAAAVASKSDAELAQAIVDGGYGQQQIASQIIINTSGATLPLSASFALFGQRYVLDSHVLANVVWARTTAMRMMPSPLDAAFAALDNDQAGALLSPELETYAYAPNLHGMRVIADHHAAAFWDGNLYNIWLSSLRALSPAADVSDPHAAGLPVVSGTEAWGRRILNTQLASWAELRHDTILYAKQSYTDGAACEFPDAYVDPYPELYAALGRFADRGSEIADLTSAAGQSALSERLHAYFTELSSVVSTLREMAELERTGTPFSAAHLAFINEAVGTEVFGCTRDGSVGWYSRLFFDNLTSDDYDPTIADVHTQPTDEGGNMVGRVLHVATGMPRLFIVTAEGCTGPRAYVGLVSSYFEKITEDFERLDDPTWSTLVNAGPSDVPWISSLLAH